MNISLSSIPLPVRSPFGTPEQLAAISWLHDGTGNLLLEGVAGCGKSWLLLEMICEINLRYPSAQIALMAYNTKISDELKAKAAKRKLRNLTIGTVHSFGFRACKSALGDHIKPNPDKLRNLAKPLCQSQHFPWTVISPLCRLVALAKDTFRTDWSDLVDHFDFAIPEETSPQQFFSLATKLLELSNAEALKGNIDFSDQLYLPLLHGWSFKKFDWVFGDEWQDANETRMTVAERSSAGRCVFVGDPAQAIYGFSGADSNSMQTTKKRFNCHTLPLSYSFRCASIIITSAQRFVPHIRARPDAPVGSLLKLKSDDFIKNLSKITPGSAILCRINSPLVSLCVKLLSQGIKCHIEGRDFAKSLISLVEKHNGPTFSDLMDSLTAHALSSTLEEEKLQDLWDKIKAIRALGTYYRQQTPRPPSFTEFLSRFFTDSIPGQEDRQSITLSSIHKSKGLEWPTVYLYGRNLWLPWPYVTQPWQLQQERNLEYVAITRAIDCFVDVEVNQEEQ